jgi:integrase
MLRDNIPPMDKKYLKLNGNTWYVRVKVPKDLRAVVGKHEEVVSLKTTSLSEAQRLRHEVVGRILSGFQSIEEPHDDNFLTPSVEYLREQQRNNTYDQELSPEELLDVVIDNERARTPDSLTDISKGKARHIKLAYHYATNIDDYPLQETIDTYLKEKEGNVTRQTLNGLKRRLEWFSDWIGGDYPVSKITTRMGGDFITKVIAVKKSRQGKDLSNKTKSDEVSNIKTFFEWCLGRGMIDVNPFARAHKTLIPKVKGSITNKVRAWSTEEIISIVGAITKKGDSPLSSLTLIAMYTGMRSNEIAEILTKDVTDGFLRIIDGKNQESIRKVPIHPMIKAMVIKLKETSSDGYLISGLTRGGEDNKRNHNIGKRFGHLKDKLGYIGRSTVLHSFRHNLITAMHNEGVPRDTAKRITGHSTNDSSTHDFYIDGVYDLVATESIQKASYGEGINRMVEKLVGTISN